MVTSDTIDFLDPSVYALSSYLIAEILAIEGVEVNPRTINRLLQKAGFPPVPRRAKLSIGETVYGAKVPHEAQILATESLEGRTVECAVQRAIGELQGSLTVLVVAHRLSTIMKADCIFVLEGGRIVEYGTRERLLAFNGRFRQLYDMQFKS